MKCRHKNFPPSL